MISYSSRNCLVLDGCCRKPRDCSRDGFLIPRCLALIRAVFAFSATSAAVFSRCLSRRAGNRLLSRCSPPLIRLILWSRSHASPGIILRPLIQQRPPSRSKMRRRTLGGIAVSGVRPTHSGTDLGIASHQIGKATLLRLSPFYPMLIPVLLDCHDQIPHLCRVKLR